MLDYNQKGSDPTSFIWNYIKFYTWLFAKNVSFMPKVSCFVLDWITLANYSRIFGKNYINIMALISVKYFEKWEWCNFEISWNIFDKKETVWLISLYNINENDEIIINTNKSSTILNPLLRFFIKTNNIKLWPHTH